MARRPRPAAALLIALLFLAGLAGWRLCCWLRPVRVVLLGGGQLPDGWLRVRTRGDRSRFDKTQTQTLAAARRRPKIIHVYRTDLLGSWLQNLLVTLLLQDPADDIVAYDGQDVVGDFSSFENQQMSSLRPRGGSCKDKFECVGADTKAVHAGYRNECLRLLFPGEAVVQWEACEPLDSDAGGTDGLDLLDVHERTRLVHGEEAQSVLSPLRAAWAERVLPWLPASSGYVAVHFRAGEVTNKYDRYLHSSTYDALLAREEKQKSGGGLLPVYVFLSGIPPAEVDDLRCFRAPGRTIVDERDASAVETLAALTHATVLVTARSSLSYVAALVRAPHLRTVWTPFWHEVPHAGVELRGAEAEEEE